MKMKNKDTSFRQKEIDEENKLGSIIDEYLVPVEDTLCCIGSCRKKNGPFQSLAHPVSYLIISSVISLVQGIFFTYSNATLSTIEKDFGLSSKLSGFTTTGNDVLLLILAIPLPFYASRGHRPRWMACGMFLSVIGCLVAASPHFIFRNRENFSESSFQNEMDSNVLHGNFGSSKFCTNYNGSTRTIKCSTSDKTDDITPHVVVSLLLIAQMLSGIASLLYYTIGHSYLDESVAKDKVPLFLAISGAMRLLGPVCGYSLASAALKVWKNPFESSKIQPSHPHWIGAWWLGYLVIGSVLFVITWALFLLPKTLPATRKRNREHLMGLAHKGREELMLRLKSLRPNGSQKWKEMLPSLKRLCQNPVYRLVVLKQVLLWFAFFGYITFKSKYIEHQFRLSAAEANRSIAVISLIASLTGWLGTGASFTLLKPSPKKVIFYMAFLSLLSCVCHLGQLSVTCDLHEIKGLDEVMKFRKDLHSLNRNASACGAVCGCVEGRFSPVCSNQSTVHYNSCFAKCFQEESDSNPNQFENSVFHLNESNMRKEDGFCSSDCPSFKIYIIISVVAKMANTAARVPANILFLRSPEERDKDLGLGLFNAMYALCSSIPAPILFGLAIDFSCMLRDDSCNTSRLCWLYDNTTFRYFIHGIPAVFLALCFVIDLLLLKYHNSIMLYSASHSSNEVPIDENLREEEENTQL